MVPWTRHSPPPSAATSSGPTIIEITNLAAVIPLNQSRDLRMSDRCTLTIKNLGSSLVAVDCIGQGKPISKGTNTLPCVYAGTNADDTGWFIRLRSLPAKP